MPLDIARSAISSFLHDSADAGIEPSPEQRKDQVKQKRSIQNTSESGSESKSLLYSNECMYREIRQAKAEL